MKQSAVFNRHLIKEIESVPFVKKHSVTKFTVLIWLSLIPAIAAVAFALQLMFGIHILFIDMENVWFTCTMFALSITVTIIDLRFQKDANSFLIAVYVMTVAAWTILLLYVIGSLLF